MGIIDYAKLAADMRRDALPGKRLDDTRRIARQALLRSTLAKIAKMKAEGLSLYNPLPSAAKAMDSVTPWQLFDGSNQSGKTIHVAYKLARILCGVDPTGHYPVHGGKCQMVGMQGEHLADPMFSKLTREGAFDIIRDEHTGLWRSTRPDPANPQALDAYDQAYKEKWRPSPPLLPPRMLASISWEDRSKGIPRAFATTNGWQVRCRSSEGKPWQGVQLNLNWLDEELAHDRQWIEEIAARNMRFGGVTMWSATPQSGGLQLYQLRQRADSGDKDVEAFTFLVDDNPFIPQERKESFFNSLSPEQRQVRYYGQYLIAGRLLYPQYDPQGVHGCEPTDVPRECTRYVVLDPGRQHCATLLVAVDPTENHLYVYDGFELQHGDAAGWAHEVEKRQGENRFEAFVIDQQMGKQHPPGAGRNVAEQYFDALMERDVQPRILGPLAGFYPGTNDIEARQEALLSAIAVRGGGPAAGTPKLRKVRGVCPELDSQIRLAQTDERGKRLKQVEDLLECLEYIVAFDPPYHEPEPLHAPPEHPVYDAFVRRQREQRQRRRW